MGVSSVNLSYYFGAAAKEVIQKKMPVGLILLNKKVKVNEILISLISLVSE